MVSQKKNLSCMEQAPSSTSIISVVFSFTCHFWPRNIFVSTPVIPSRCTQSYTNWNCVCVLARNEKKNDAPIHRKNLLFAFILRRKICFFFKMHAILHVTINSIMLLSILRWHSSITYRVDMFRTDSNRSTVALRWWTLSRNPERKVALTTAHNSTNVDCRRAQNCLNIYCKIHLEHFWLVFQNCPFITIS